MSVDVTVDDKPEPEQETFVDLKARRNKRLRMAALALFFVGSIVLAKVTGLDEYLDVETVRAMMESAGVLGFLAFLGVFCVGELLHVPGLVFVGAASIAYGSVLGIGAGYLGALLSVTVSFLVVRTIGGQPLADVKRPFMVKILARLETHPIATIAVLRLLFWLSPPLNYGLAMSKVTLRDYLVGSALGLLVPIPMAVLAFDWLAGFLL